MLNKVSTWQVGKWLDDLAYDTSYAALAFAEPTEGDPLSVEVTGPGYRRQRVYWTRRGRAAFNRVEVEFSGLEIPIGLVAVMIFDAPHAGRVRASGVLPQPITLIETSGFTFGVGEIALYVD